MAPRIYRCNYRRLTLNSLEEEINKIEEEAVEVVYPFKILPQPEQTFIKAVQQLPSSHRVSNLCQHFILRQHMAVVE